MKFKKGSKHKITKETTLMRGILQGKMPKISRMITDIKVADAVNAVTKQQRAKQK